MTAVKSYVAVCGGFLFEFTQVASALQNACLYLEPLSAVQRLTLVCPGLALLFLSPAPVALARRGAALPSGGAVRYTPACHAPNSTLLPLRIRD